MSYNVISMQNRGLVPNHEASAVKIYAGELNQRIQNTALKMLGLFGQLTGGPGAPNKGRFARVYLQAVASTIAGGTSRDQPEYHRDAGAGAAAGLKWGAFEHGGHGGGTEGH